MARSILLVGAALISVSISPLNAEASEGRWCAVISRSDGDVHWDCTYRSIEECRPNVIASNGKRSFCNPSPSYVANPTELRNSRPASQMGSKTSAKSERAIAVKRGAAVKKESPQHRASTTTATKITTVKPEKVATAAKPTVAKPRSQTESVEEKANSRTITEPGVPPSTQPLATPGPVPKTEPTTIGGKAESQAAGQPSETSDPVLKKEPTTIAGRTEGPASGQPAETSEPVLNKATTAIGGKVESQATGQPSETPGPIPKKEPTTIAGRTEGPASGQPAETSDPVLNAATNAIGGKAESQATGQPSETSDPVLKKAKIVVAAKMEDAEFVDMKRIMRKSSFGEPFEIICGHVKGKMKSGEATGDRPFLYLVKEDEAFIVGGNPDSMAAIAYRVHCTLNSH